MPTLIIRIKTNRKLTNAEVDDLCDDLELDIDTLSDDEDLEVEEISTQHLKK